MFDKNVLAVVCRHKWDGSVQFIESFFRERLLLNQERLQIRPKSCQVSL